MPVEIIQARTDEQYAQARALVSEYADCLGMDLEFQGFTHELASLRATYGPPRGAMLLVRDGGKYVGCAGLRPIDERIAEMKRMYVLPACRGRGIGRLLLSAFLAKARELGYRAVRLDTIPRLTAALALYRKAGFVPIEPYRYNPEKDAIFLELKL